MDVGAHSSASSGEILVYGSRRPLASTDRDEAGGQLRLPVYPVVLGAGGRLFGEAQDKIALTSTTQADLMLPEQERN